MELHKSYTDVKKLSKFKRFRTETAAIMAPKEGG